MSLAHEILINSEAFNNGAPSMVTLVPGAACDIHPNFVFPYAFVLSASFSGGGADHEGLCYCLS